MAFVKTQFDLICFFFRPLSLLLLSIRNVWSNRFNSHKWYGIHLIKPKKFKLINMGSITLSSIEQISEFSDLITQFDINRNLQHFRNSLMDQKKDLIEPGCKQYTAQWTNYSFITILLYEWDGIISFEEEKKNSSFATINVMQY